MEEFALEELDPPSGNHQGKAEHDVHLHHCREQSPSDVLVQIPIHQARHFVDEARKEPVAVDEDGKEIGKADSSEVMLQSLRVIVERANERVRKVQRYHQQVGQVSVKPLRLYRH